MGENCDHKFVDTNYCLKCGRLAAELSGDQRSSRTLAPPAWRERGSVGAEQWIATLEQALHAARRRNVEARNLIRVLSKHASDDHLRERIRTWLEGDPAPAEPEQIGGALLGNVRRFR